MIRNFKDTDIFAIEDIHESLHNFPMTNLNGPTKVLKKTIEIDNVIVGSAYVTLTAEVGLILDKTLPTLKRASVIKEVFEDFLKEMSQTDIEDVYIFIENNDLKFKEFLKDNFNFKDNNWIAVYRRLK